MNTWVNGRAGRSLDTRDRGLAYGDGVFETLRTHHGTVRLLNHHLERLQESCRRLDIGVPAPRLLRREFTTAAALKRDAVLKLIVTRGIGQRGYRATGHERSTRILTLHALPAHAAQAARLPVRVRLCATRLGINAALAGLKTLNRLESVLARAEWRSPHIWEGLMRDSDGHIVCGTMTNVFVRRGAFLMTPMIDRCGVSGVMRRWVLEQAAALDLRGVEGRLRWEDLDETAEVFLTNAVVGVVPVGSIESGRVRLRLCEHATADALQRLLAGV